jgi:hypothetical protein
MKINKTGVIIAVIVIVFIVSILGVITYVHKEEQKYKELMLQDERLKNAKQFYMGHPIAISPDGFIGIVKFKKITIINIIDIKGFSILFDIEEVENDTGMLIFNNIISKVEPYLIKKIKDIGLYLYTKDDFIFIHLLDDNTTTTRKRNSDIEIETVNDVPERAQERIKEFLSELENLEKSVKGKS